MKSSLNSFRAVARKSHFPGSRASAAFALVGMFTLLLLSAACHQASTQSVVMPAVPVAVAQAERRDVPVVVNAIGAIAPYSTVQIKTMVSAGIDKAFFKEGDFVKKGELLFQLDPRKL